MPLTRLRIRRTVFMGLRANWRGLAATADDGHFFPRQDSGTEAWAWGHAIMNLVFIGAGKMATAIASGLAEAGELEIASMAAVDPVPEARAAFTQCTGVRCEVLPATVLPDAGVVLLAVKPQKAAAAVAPIAGLCVGKLIVSIAAGLPLSRLSDWFHTERVVRVMPNTPLMVGKGATVLAPGPGVADADRAFVRRIFGALGIVHELPEEAIDAVTALSGSGPAYVFELIQGLVDGAVALGLPAEVALSLTTQTVAGVAEMLQRGMGSPDELRTAVTSPGGTTAAGLGVLAAADFRLLLQDVVQAAAQRSIELGRNS